VKLALACAMLAAALAACSAAPAHDDSLERVVVARKVFGAHHFQFFYVPAESKLRDLQFIARSKTGSPSQYARALSRLMAAGERDDVRLAVGGPNNAKVAAVVKDAAGLIAGRRLAYLTLLFVGDPGEDRDLKTRVEALAAHYQSTPFR
jgi:hypothetical protein